jgi:hypothetical protein
LLAEDGLHSVLLLDDGANSPKPARRCIRLSGCLLVYSAGRVANDDRALGGRDLQPHASERISVYPQKNRYRVFDPKRDMYSICLLCKGILCHSANGVRHVVPGQCPYSDGQLEHISVYAEKTDIGVCGENPMQTGFSACRGSPPSNDPSQTVKFYARSSQSHLLRLSKARTTHNRRANRSSVCRCRQSTMATRRVTSQSNKQLSDPLRANTVTTFSKDL